MQKIVMKNSLKPLVGVIGTLSISFGIGLPTLAQPQPMLSQTTPSPELPPEEPVSPSAPAPSRPPVPAAPVGVSVPASSSSQTTDAIVRQSPSFELFNALLRVANNRGSLTSALLGDGDYTIFAPTDEALVTLPSGLFKALVQPENSDTLARILANHIVRGKVLSSQLSGREVRSLDGNVLSLGSVPVVAPDIQASNGVIHAINGVILPPDVQASLAGLTPQPVTSGPPSQ